MGMIKDIWDFRNFILGSVRREFQLKYRNSLLGSTWAFLSPLAMILVYTLVFSEVMKASMPGVDNKFAYSIYLCAGILTWGLFLEIITGCQTIFLNNATLLKKVSFPKICLPVVILLSALLNFSITFGLFTGFLVLSGNFPGPVYFALFPLLFIEILFSISLGIIIGVLNVFFRDIGQITGVAMQLWFWFTPIVYLKSLLSESAQSWVSLNPLANLIGAYQEILVFGKLPRWPSLLTICVVSIILCILAMWLFRRSAVEIVDEL